MLQAKEYSNQLCREYGLSVTETKTKNPRNARWKRDLIETASYAIGWSATKEEFIEYMREHGYGVQWEDKYKYITFTTPEGYKVRDNKLFDERFLKNNLELYFAMGGCDGEMLDTYCDYVTPYHDDSFNHDLQRRTDQSPRIYTFNCSRGLLLSAALRQRNEHNGKAPPRKKILGRKISNEAFVTYCTREDYEREQGISQSY